jgi:hypothetical protein
MQVHGQYTLYAHFQVLKRLLGGAKSIPVSAQTLPIDEKKRASNEARCNHFSGPFTNAFVVRVVEYEGPFQSKNDSLKAVQPTAFN